MEVVGVEPTSVNNLIKDILHVYFIPNFILKTNKN